MVVDPRCLIATDLGRLKDGSGLSEDHVQGLGLITYRGTFIFDGIFTPARGRVIQVAYARPQYGASGTLTRFHPRLHVISSSADPFANETTVEVGCQLELMRDRQDAITFRAEDNPPAWWSALSTDRRAVLPPTIEAQAVIQFCLAKLGISLASGSATSPDNFVREEIDLSGGYVQVIDDLLRSALLWGHMTPAGALLVQPVTLSPGTGPVLRRDNLISLQPINDKGGAEKVTVEFDAIEAPPNAEVGEEPAPGDPREIDIYDPEWVEQQEARNWELERTISPPTTHTIEFFGRRWRTTAGGVTELPSDARFSVDVQVTQVSENRTTYQTINYKDAEGKDQSQDVASRRVSSTRSSVSGKEYFIAKSAMVDLGGGSGGQAFIFPPSGAIPVDTDTITEYTYEVTEEGPRLKTEETTVTQAEPGYAASLPIEDWTFGTGIPELVGATQVSRVVVENEVDEVSGLTKRKTTRWAASSRTQGGSQAARSSFQGVQTGAEFEKALASAKPLIMEGTEVTTSLGRQSGLQSRPSPQDRFAEILNPFKDDNSLTDSGTLASSQGQEDPQVVTTEYSFGDAGTDQWNSTTMRLPYAPDDFVSGANGSATGILNVELIRGRARARALLYGETQNALSFGHANGVEVTTAAWELPSAPFSPVYVDISGLSTAFRVNGRNWEIRNGCLIVTADLLLVGTAGRLTGETPISWTPLPADPTVLNALGAPTGSGDLIPANTITLPSGFNPDAPGSVWSSLPANGSDTYGPSRTPGSINPPYVQTVPILARSRSAVVVTELLYSVAPITEDVLAVSRSRAIVTEVTLMPVVSRSVIEMVAGDIIGGPPPGDGSLIDLRFEGDDASTDIVDISSYARTVTVFGNAQIDTAHFDEGAASMLCDTAGSYAEESYIKVAQDSVFTVTSSSVFWLRARIKLSAKGANVHTYRIISSDDGLGRGIRVESHPSSADTRIVISNSTGNQHTATFTGVVTAWNTLDVMVDTGKVVIRMNGTTLLDATASGLPWAFSQSGMTIGKVGDIDPREWWLDAFQIFPYTILPQPFPAVSRSIVAMSEVLPDIDVPSITYSQSSVWADNTAATNAGMTNGVSAETLQTGTDTGSPAWVRMDFGERCWVKTLVIGCDFTNTLAGEWGKTFAENLRIELSDDSSSWTDVGSTGTFSSGIKNITIDAAARYLRVRANDYIAITEFYAVST